MLIPPLGEARKDVIHLAGIGRKQAERGSDAAQVDEADVLQFREGSPAVELEAQHAIIQGVSGVWIRSSCASRAPLYRTLRLRVLHPTVVNDREPCSQHNIERRVPCMLGNHHFWRIYSVDDLTEPPHCLTVEQYRVRPGFQLLHQTLSQLNAVRLQVLAKILPPGVDAPGGQDDPGGRTPPAQGSQHSRELLLPGLLRVVDHDEKLGGELRKVCQLVIPHRALGGRKTCVPAKYLQIVAQLRRYTGLTRPSRSGQHGDRDIWLPSGTLGSSQRPFLELPILRTRAKRHHAVAGLDHLQRRTVIRQRQVTRRQHLLSTRQGGELRAVVLLSSNASNIDAYIPVPLLDIGGTGGNCAGPVTGAPVGRVGRLLHIDGQPATHRIIRDTRDEIPDIVTTEDQGTTGEALIEEGGHPKGPPAIHRHEHERMAPALLLTDRQEERVDPGIQSGTTERCTHIETGRLSQGQYLVDSANSLRPGDTLGRLVNIRDMKLGKLVEDLLRNALDLAEPFSLTGFITGEATPVLSRERPLDPSGVDDLRNTHRVPAPVPRHWFSHDTAPTRP